MSSTAPRTGSQEAAGSAGSAGSGGSGVSSARIKPPKDEDFVFGKMIGEGSFSCVFLARDASTQKGTPHQEYAIKVCEKKKILKEQKTAEYIMREKDILATITEHLKGDSRVPFFVKLHSTFQDPEKMFFAMTYASNGDLLKFIDKMAERDIDCVQFYAAELLAAVEFLHFKVGVIHRDLKPENILLNHKMHILITDFGSAKFIKEKYNLNAGRQKPPRRFQPPEQDDSDDDEREVSAVRRAMESANVGGGGAAASPDRGGCSRVRGGSHPGEDDSDSDVASTRGSKRRSFVGTAQYLSPEILTSRGSCRASDLWAIGCIIYQMITGLPPFQSDSDWLIFKKIEKLDYTFQDGFDREAESLIRQLLVIDPDARLGAKNRKRYDTVRQHPFFQGVDFHSLPDSIPPSLESEVSEIRTVDPLWAKEPDRKPGAWILPQLELDYYCDDSKEEEDDVMLFPPGGMQYVGPLLGGANKQQPNALHQSTSPSEIQNSAGQGKSGLQPTVEAIRKRWTKNHVLQSAALSQIDREILMSHQTSSNKYHRFVEGNLIIREGILDKKKGLLARRRMFLLTEGPRLYYVDPVKKVLKGQVPLTKEVKMEVRDPRIFFLHTPGRIYYLLDPQSEAQFWCEAVEDTITRYFGNELASDQS